MAHGKTVGNEGHRATVRGTVSPIRDNILITDMNFDQRVTKGGVILLSDDGKSEGVRHRWGRVWAVGPEQKEVEVGDWILLEHGRWTRGVNIVGEDGKEITIRRADNNAILIVSKEAPGDNTLGAHSTVEHQTFTF
jgi:co-chaperonin GroES (HSP10)